MHAATRVRDGDGRRQRSRSRVRRNDDNDNDNAGRPGPPEGAEGRVLGGGRESARLSRCQASTINTATGASRDRQTGQAVVFCGEQGYGGRPGQQSRDQDKGEEGEG
jgi:hypothetical protein